MPLFVCELDELLRLNPIIPKNMMDYRRGKSTRLPPTDPLRQTIYGRLAVYEHLK